MDWRNWEEVKKRLRIRLVSVKGNEEALQTVPHREYEDIAMVYRLEIYNRGSERAYATVGYKDLIQYKVSKEELHWSAMEAACRNNHITVSPIGSLFDAEGLYAEAPELFWVVTTDEPWGAWAVFYPGMMEECAKIMGRNSYFILPSSVHEMLLMPDGNVKAEDLQQMVANINRSAVEPKDRLTDSVYYYDSLTGSFRKVA